MEDTIGPSPAQEGECTRRGHQDVSQGEEEERPEGRKGDPNQADGEESRLKAVRCLPVHAAARPNSFQDAHECRPPAPGRCPGVIRPRNSLGTDRIERGYGAATADRIASLPVRDAIP